MSGRLEMLFEAMTEAVDEENRIGGEARGIVLEVGRILGVDLTQDPVDGQTWGEANMRRVVQAAKNSRYDVRRLQGLPEFGFVQ
jgi:hypothetical protein